MFCPGTWSGPIAAIDHRLVKIAQIIAGAKRGARPIAQPGDFVVAHLIPSCYESCSLQLGISVSARQWIGAAIEQGEVVQMGVNPAPLPSHGLAHDTDLSEISSAVLAVAKETASFCETVCMVTMVLLQTVRRRQFGGAAPDRSSSLGEVLVDQFHGFAEG